MEYQRQENRSLGTGIQAQHGRHPIRAVNSALIQTLLAEGAIINAYDPEAMAKARDVLPAVNYCNDPYEAAQGTDAILIVTEWDEFRTVDWQRLAKVVDRRLIIDGRNIFQPEAVSVQGFQYLSIGRMPAVPHSGEAVVSA